MIGEANGPLRPYIQSAELNGKPFDRCFVTHDEITAGGEVLFRMGSFMNKEWAAESRPFSETKR